MTANPFSGKTLAVMLGGTAAERSISLDSGENVARALEQAGAQVLRVDTAEEGWPEQLKEASFAFNLLHGPGGEDGRLQRLRSHGICTDHGQGPHQVALAGSGFAYTRLSPIDAGDELAGCDRGIGHSVCETSA
jgi:hypothetical protein